MVQAIFPMEELGQEIPGLEWLLYVLCFTNPVVPKEA